MTTFYAQPYDITASGFYFETFEQYEERAAKALNDHGQPVEEFEIQYIDGDDLDAALAEAWSLNQASLSRFFEANEEWEDHEKIRFIIAKRQGIAFDPESDELDMLDVDIYGVDGLRELAEQFVEDGLYGEVPEVLSGYIDYDAIARDLGMEFAETVIAGERLVYRCG